MRRALALAAVLLVGGIIPCNAMQACASKACCAHRTTATPVLAPGCCNQTGACTLRPPDAEVAAQLSAPTALPASALTAIHTIRQPAAAAVLPLERIEHGSPPTSRRLAALSILLI